MVGIFFTDVAGLPLRRPSGLSYIEIRAVIRFKNFIPKTLHQIFEHIHGILSKIYLQNFLHGYVVNRETNLMSLVNL